MGATGTLSRFITETRTADLPAVALHEAKRTLINTLAISISASVDHSVQALEAWGGGDPSGTAASIFGRGRGSMGQAALVNGYLAHLQDYDDTHFPTILHPSSPAWPAVLAAAEHTGASGLEVLAAFALGAEASCRVAMSVHPWHYDAGWHITGTVGIFGAAAGAGRLLGLSAGQMAEALGLAGTNAAGVRDAFGTNGKALHVGHAAMSGLRAAMLVRGGFTGPTEILEGRRGFWAVLSPNGHDATYIEKIGAPGERWELQNNGLKPYANGVVSHPLQDAVIQLRRRHSLTADAVRSIDARVHPLVLELMNRPQPESGLSGKFSHQHCAAAALVDGAGHEAQFSDARVADPVIASVRAMVHATPDPSLAEEEVHVAIRLADGSEVATHVEHATGSPHNPMTDAQLEEKYRAITVEVIGERRAEELLQAAWSLDSAPNVAELMRLASGAGASNR